MNLSVDKKIFYKYLSYVQGIVDTRPSMLILLANWFSAVTFDPADRFFKGIIIIFKKNWPFFGLSNLFY